MNKYFLILLLFTFLFNSPNIYASGDPMVLISIVGAGLLQSLFVATFFYLPNFKKCPIINTLLFIIVNIPLWQWSMTYKGPDFVFMYIELFGISIITYILLFSINKTSSNK